MFLMNKISGAGGGEVNIFERLENIADLWVVKNLSMKWIISKQIPGPWQQGWVFC